MKNFERLLIVALGVLVLLAVAVVVLGPRMGGQEEMAQEDIQAGETETMAARVVEILEEDTVEVGEGNEQLYQRLLLRVESGTMAGQEIVVEEGTVNIVGQQRLFDVGDRVFVERAVAREGGEDRLYISDFRRTGSLVGVIALFIGLVVLVGRGKGLRSLGGSLFSLGVIFAFILPQILRGRDPVSISIVGSILLLSVSTYLTYGWNIKAHAAVAGMALSLALTGGLAWLFVSWTRLTGMGMEESSYLVMEIGPNVNLRGLVLGGIIIGSLGVLDDVCVAQASVIIELIDANPDLGWLELFQRSLNIGTDHIAAMVNTLLLAYVGGSMPLMLAFTLYQEPLWRRINREPIAEEIVRTLVGSAGLVLAVPITSLIASLLARWALSPSRPSGKVGADAE